MAFLALLSCSTISSAPQDTQRVGYRAWLQMSPATLWSHALLAGILLPAGLGVPGRVALAAWGRRGGTGGITRAQTAAQVALKPRAGLLGAGKPQCEQPHTVCPRTEGSPPPGPVPWARPEGSAQKSGCWGHPEQTLRGGRVGARQVAETYIFPACILFLEEGEGRVLDH